jgi:hypothetical protein
MQIFEGREYARQHPEVAYYDQTSVFLDNLSRQGRSGSVTIEITAWGAVREYSGPYLESAGSDTRIYADMNISSSSSQQSIK